MLQSQKQLFDRIVRVQSFSAKAHHFHKARTRRFQTSPSSLSIFVTNDPACFAVLNLTVDNPVNPYHDNLLFHAVAKGWNSGLVLKSLWTNRPELQAV